MQTSRLAQQDAEPRVTAVCGFHGERPSAEEEPFRKPAGHRFRRSDGVSAEHTHPTLWPSELGDRRREGPPSAGSEFGMTRTTR